MITLKTDSDLELLDIGLNNSFIDSLFSSPMLVSNSRESFKNPIKTAFESIVDRSGKHSLKETKKRYSDIIAATEPKERPPTIFKEEGVSFKELNDKVIFEILAPGREKKDFDINSVENEGDVGFIEITSEAKPGKDEDVSRYAQSAIKHSLMVDKDMDLSKASAKYEGGLLILTVPKKLDKIKKVVSKEIKIQ